MSRFVASVVTPAPAILVRDCGFSNKKITIKLDDTNFLLWKQQVYFMVKQHRVYSLLDDTVTLPPETIRGDDGSTIPNPAFEEHESLDSALASWLLASIASNILPDLVGLTSAAQIWAKLNQLFSNKSDVKILSDEGLFVFSLGVHNQK
ncbi:hypothetical protein QN277_014355 [Acacia crassicarpa]|uniref:Retrotransposon Copia-like N-terminal domain-containing protein n=1 Tax=Acacia crassicarpa TaxID=499986 RepID=A0AAE1JGD2_9FABA|nr:hypothetical protein QN277_014355 [Acacia crassicarpa]